MGGTVKATGNPSRIDCTRELAPALTAGRARRGSARWRRACGAPGRSRWSGCRPWWARRSMAAPSSSAAPTSRCSGTRSALVPSHDPHLTTCSPLGGCLCLEPMPRRLGFSIRAFLGQYWAGLASPSAARFFSGRSTVRVRARGAHRSSATRRKCEEAEQLECRCVGPVASRYVFEEVGGCMAWQI